MRLLLATAVLLGFATCAAPEPALHTAEGAPIVGKLQLRDHSVELTLDAFGEQPDQIDPSFRAEVMADIDLDAKTPRSGVKREP